MIKRVKKSKFHNNQTGASLVEYALLVALIAVVVMAGMRSFGESVAMRYDDINREVGIASGGVCLSLNPEDCPT